MFILTSDVLRCLEALGDSNGRLRVDTLLLCFFQFAILQCCVKSVAQGSLPPGFMSVRFEQFVCANHLKAELYSSWLAVYPRLQV